MKDAALDFSFLSSNWKSVSEERKALYAQMAMLVKAVVGSECDPSVVMRMLATISCNALSVCDAELTEHGIGVYPLLSMVNHSCVPNACVEFSGKSCSLRALRPIAVGEQVYISYIDVFVPLETRQSQLKEGYYFPCSCPLCTDPKLDLDRSGIACMRRFPGKDDSTSNTISTRDREERRCNGVLPDPHPSIFVAVGSNDETNISSVSCSKCLGSVSGDKVIGQVSEITSILNEADSVRVASDHTAAMEKLSSLYERVSDLTGPHHVSRIQLLSKLVSTATELGAFEEAAKYCSLLLVTYGDVVSPVVSVDACRLAKLQLHLNDYAGCIDSCRTFLPVLAVTHGKSSPLFKEMESLMCHATMECRR